MLAAFARTGFFFNWVPLIVNALASCATAVVFARMLLHFGVLQRRAELAAASVLVVALCIALNIVGVVFTGLEHSLHVLVTVAIIYGLARAHRRGSFSALSSIPCCDSKDWPCPDCAFWRCYGPDSGAGRWPRA